MATRNSESEALAERCRKAGWEVEQLGQGGSAGWRVTPPNGRPYSIHTTYSDRNSITAVTRDLDAAGLTDTENAIKKERLTANRTKNAIAREVAERKAQRMAANASLARAAGPYYSEPERVELDWFIKPHPAPWMRWALVTPAIAKVVVDEYNADNRKLDPHTVTYYSRIIDAKLWHLTHQGLAFDTRGYLQDGQHRLQALLLAAKTDSSIVGVPFAVFVGMPEENFKSIDEGKLRTARQLFGKAGEKYAGPMQTCVRLVHYLNDVDARRSTRLRLPNQQILDEFEADADQFRISTVFGAMNYQKSSLSAGALSAAHYILRKVNGVDNPYVSDFFAGLASGLYPGTRTVLDDVDPRAVLRRTMFDLRLKAKSRTSLTQVGMVITSWNNCVISKTVRNLVFHEDSPIPNILRCLPGEGVAPTAFRRP